MRFLSLLMILWCLPSSLQADDAPRLQGRERAEGAQLTPREAQLQRVWSQRELTLAVVQPDNPPLDILGTGRDFEGISADYAGLVAEHLHLTIRVRPYPSFATALAALHTGQVDVLASVTGVQAAENGLLLSTPYATDRPTLLAREDDEQACAPTRPVRLAMREGYRHLDSVRALYPQAKLQLYPSNRMALSALAFGQAQLYLGGETEIQFQAGKGLLGNFEVINCPVPAAQPVGFAVHPGNPSLLALFDGVLIAISPSQRQRIRWRWRGHGPVERAMPVLDDDERRWLDRQPTVRVMLNEHYPPISFRDADGQMRGLAVDVLRRISRRTGLSFEFAGAGSCEAMINQVRQGKADLAAGVTTSERREAHLVFTRAFVSSPRVLVTLDHKDAPASLEQLDGQRLALAHTGLPREYLARYHPLVRLVDVPGPMEAAARVANGSADAALVPLIGAQSFADQGRTPRLKVSAGLPLEPAYFAFASRQGARELHSILDKALLSMSPQEMAALQRRWQSPIIVPDSLWQRYRSQVLHGFALVGGALLVALAWVRYLRRQVRVREQAEQALAAQLEFMRVMIDGTPHPIYVCNAQGHLLMCNSSYLQALSVEYHDVIGQMAGLSVAEDWAKACRQVLADDRPRIEDRRVCRPDGSSMTLYHWMLPYRHEGEAGVIAGWIDISERQRLHKALQHAKEQADQANQTKTRFLATMSHEIRTPLNAVLGMLELAMRKAEQGILDRLSIEVASEAARNLKELIGDILDVTRIESGHLQLAPQPVNLRQQVETLVQLFEPQAQAKRLRLRMDTDGEVDALVMLDPLRFKQILANLLSNAIKFTDHGGVRVVLKVARLQGQQVVRLTVEDSGIGIPDADLARLGELFRQASNNPQSARCGAGLGLSISRTLCEMMGGRMRLHSALGVGTRIDIELSLPLFNGLRTVPAEPRELVAAGNASLRVLVVDDYPANRLLLASQLDYLGHRATVEEHGAVGLSRWLGECFDVVISDCNMPVLDGYRMVRAMRLHERLTGRRRCRVLGLTANALADERRHCRRAGMDDCLFKPLDLGMLARVLEHQGAQAPAEALPTPDLTFDLIGLERLTGDNATLLWAMVDELRTSLRDDLAKLLEHATAADSPSLLAQVHRIKGGARMAKAQPLIQACEQIERDGASEAGLSALGQAMVTLERALAARFGQCPSDAPQQQQNQQHHQHHPDDTRRAITPGARVGEDR